MRKLRLEFDQYWNKEFEIKEVNLLYLFQVNCPGCFTHGFPLIEQLRRKYSENLSFTAMSTAFEDFALNSVGNTKQLIEENQLVGEVEKADIAYGIDKSNLPVTYTVLMDRLVKPEAFLVEDVIEEVCKTNPNYDYWSSYDKELLQDRVRVYYKNFEHIALTFHLNQFRGTPTFVIFNKEYDILDTWFGHKPESEAEHIIDKWIGNHPLT